MKPIYFLIALALIIAGCEKTITVDIPQRDPKLVVSAWMAKDSVIDVMVSTSRNILAPLSSPNTSFESYIVKNAKPVIYEDGIAIDTLVYLANGSHFYRSPRKKTVRQGHIYVVRVTAPGYAEASATTLVPTQTVIGSVTRVREARTLSGGEKQDEITVKFNDPSEKNFYLIQFYHASPAGSGGYPVYCVSTTDKDVEPIGDDADPVSTDNCYDGARLLLKDVNFNGREKQVRFYIDSYELEEIFQNGKRYRPYFTLNGITEDYFKFVKSYDAYDRSSNNPFAEPANVFNNVTNGYGTFSAYTRAVDTLK